MKNPLFVEVRGAISKWLKDNNEKFKNKNILLEVLKDDENCLRVELNFGELLAEILVEEPDFAPYRYVSFQAVGIVNGVPDLMYFWYDEEKTSVEDIIENLTKAIDVVFEYNYRLKE